MQEARRPVAFVRRRSTEEGASARRWFAHCGECRKARRATSRVAKPLLSLILGHADLAVQKGHLTRGALFIPEPEPLPEPFLEIISPRRDRRGNRGSSSRGGSSKILPGHGIAVAVRRHGRGQGEARACCFSEPAGSDEGATFVFWGRVERPLTVPPANISPS